MELSIVIFLNHLTLPSLDVLTTTISNEILLGVICFLCVVCVYFCDVAQRRIVITSVVLALLLHFFITEFLIKDTFSDFLFRARPYTINPLIHQIGTLYVDSSFPSSHMASTLSVITVYFLFYRKYWPYMLTFILLMAFARIHNGMHYPTDVIAGTLLGICYGTVAMYLVDYYGYLHRQKK